MATKINFLWKIINLLCSALRQTAKKLRIAYCVTIPFKEHKATLTGQEREVGGTSEHKDIRVSCLRYRRLTSRQTLGLLMTVFPNLFCLVYALSLSVIP